MKKLIAIAAFIAIGFTANAQTAPATTPTVKLTDTAKLYHPNADAKADIAAAVKKASAEHKNVLLQIGGNWCIWCARFHDFVTKDASIDSLIKANYVVYHMNYASYLLHSPCRQIMGILC